MFDKINTDIPGCFELIPRKVEDDRGCFVKTYQRSLFDSLGLDTEWREEYYSVSRKGVLRGMHFQLPPHDHHKLVYCTTGEVLDAVLDLRKSSPMYGRHLLLPLSASRANMIYIPKGCAHGFYTVSETATMMYMVGTEYVADADSGILWSSVGIQWPNNNPIISQRDKRFIKFTDFLSPFAYNQIAI